MMTRHLGPAVVAFIAMGLLTPPDEARGSQHTGEETAAGQLKELVTTALHLAKSGDQAKLKEIAHGLMIPNYEVWLKETFEKKGAQKAAEAFKRPDSNDTRLPGYFEFLAKQEGELFVEPVELRTSPLDGIWCGEELLVPIKSAAFYRVMWLKEEQDGKRKLANVGYFVFVDGSYRRLACEIPRFEPSAISRWEGPIRLGGNVEAAKIIYRVRPIYPQEAQKAQISGTVRLHVVLARDGTVEQIELMSGDSLLAKAAMDAVERWTYAVTLLNGTPMRVDTTVDLVFSQ